MAEAGILSIMRRGHTYRIRYASSNLYDMDRPPYLCPDEGAMITLLHHYGIDACLSNRPLPSCGRGHGSPASGTL